MANKSYNLPKAFKTSKSKDSSSSSSSGSGKSLNGIGSIIVTILIIGLIAFVLLGGISQVGFLKWIWNWGQSTASNVGSWVNDGHIVVNDDGVYIDPSGKKGIKADDSAVTSSKDTSSKNDSSEEDNSKDDSSNVQTNPNNSEVKTE